MPRFASVFRRRWAVRFRTLRRRRSLRGFRPIRCKSRRRIGSSGENAGKAASAAAPNFGTTTLTKADHKQRPIVFAPAGDWLRDETSLSIRYRPKAHADPVFATWLNVLAETPDLNQRPIAAATFKELSKPTAPGLCVSCHSVERSATNELVVNWRAMTARVNFAVSQSFRMARICCCRSWRTARIATRSTARRAGDCVCRCCADAIRQRLCAAIQAAVHRMPHGASGGRSLPDRATITTWRVRVRGSGFKTLSSGHTRT